MQLENSKEILGEKKNMSVFIRTLTALFLLNLMA